MKMTQLNLSFAKEDKTNIFTEVNDLFRKIFETKNSDDFIKFLRFIKRFRNRSPFNNALVFAQNPDCYYWATAKEWELLKKNRSNKRKNEQTSLC